MKHLKQFENWTTTTTEPNKEVDVQYTSKDKITYGIHDINISRDGVRTKVKAKFDSGARSSSIDFKVAKRLGISDEFLKTCKELDSVDLSKYAKNPRNISIMEQGKIERGFYKDLKTKFPELSDVKLVKSSSGFSLRMVIKINIEYNGKIISTDANLRDRTGLACEMLVGLKDMFIQEVKHLRKFNEGKAPDQSEIFILSRDYLAYLIDDDYACDVHTGYEWSHTTDKIKSKLVTNIVLRKYKDKYKGTIGEFLWDECKDHFIAFIHLLSKDYNIDNFAFTRIGLQTGSIVPVLVSSKRSLQQVLDDDDCNFESLQRVTVVISKKE